jgi:hypothetical protein
MPHGTINRVAAETRDKAGNSEFTVTIYDCIDKEVVSHNYPRKISTHDIRDWQRFRFADRDFRGDGVEAGLPEWLA